MRLIGFSKNFSLRQGILASVLSGLITLLSQPGYGLDGLIWCALVPIFFVLGRVSSAKQAFALVWLAGFVYFGFLLYWLYALSDWAGPWIALGHLVLVAYLACYWGIFAALGFILIKKRLSWSACLTLPAIWVTLEFARSLTRFGFTWGYLSDALFARPELIQLASVGGAWLISFIIVLCNYLLFLCWEEKKFRFAVLALLLFSANWVVGVAMLKEKPHGRLLDIALIHSHVNQRDRSDPSQLDRLIELYTGQIQQLNTASVQLVILPETILPAFLLRNSEIFERFSTLAREKSVWLLVGAIDYKPTKPAGTFNTAALISPAGRLISEYDKVQLVPFSTEYFPFIDNLKQWDFLSNLLNRIPLGSLTPGRDFAVLESTLGKFATPICFESIFPQISRAFVLKGAGALLILTNDGWFKDGFALQQHFAKGVFRAVENRRYFVQTSNAGITGLVSSNGEIKTSTIAKKEQTLLGRVVLHEGWTLYTRYGDWFIYFCLMLTVLVLVQAWLKKETHYQSDSLKHSKAEPE
jgi:apolipoprotein N-acyltransferase